MLRELRRADAPRIAELMRTSFPEEERLLGSRPEEFAKVADRLFRPDTRILLGFLRAIGRPIARFFVREADGHVVGTTLTTFPPRAGYLSMVMVDPAYRRRGFARELIEAGRRAAVRRGRPYVALDVLDENVPARTLYESVGYRPLRPSAYYVNDAPAAAGPSTTLPPHVRAYVPRDVAAIIAAHRSVTPPAIEEVLPLTTRQVRPNGWGAGIFNADSGAWVVDRGAGAEAFCTASVPRAMEAGHLSCPIVGRSADPALASALIRTATAWLGARGVPRVVTRVPADLTGARAAIESIGYRHAIPITTFYRSAA